MSLREPLWKLKVSGQGTKVVVGKCSRGMKSSANYPPTHFSAAIPCWGGCVFPMNAASPISNASLYIQRRIKIRPPRQMHQVCSLLARLNFDGTRLSVPRQFCAIGFSGVLLTRTSTPNRPDPRPASRNRMHPHKSLLARQRSLGKNTPLSGAYHSQIIRRKF